MNLMKILRPVRSKEALFVYGFLAGTFIHGAFNSGLMSYMFAPYDAKMLSIVGLLIIFLKAYRGDMTVVDVSGVGNPRKLKQVFEKRRDDIIAREERMKQEAHDG